MFSCSQEKARVCFVYGTELQSNRQMPSTVVSYVSRQPAGRERRLHNFFKNTIYSDTMKIIQRKTCEECKALIESPDKLISLLMDANIVIFTCQLGYKMDRSMAIPKEPCPKPKSDKALLGCKKFR